jgi:hypothetical protein
MPVPGYEVRGAVRSGGIVFSSFRVGNAPAGTAVTVRVGGARFTRRGTGPVAGLVNRYVRSGGTLVISFKRPGRCTSTRTLRVVRSGGGFTLRATRLTYTSPTPGGRCT